MEAIIAAQLPQFWKTLGVAVILAITLRGVLGATDNILGLVAFRHPNTVPRSIPSPPDVLSRIWISPLLVVVCGSLGWFLHLGLTAKGILIAGTIPNGFVAGGVAGAAMIFVEACLLWLLAERAMTILIVLGIVTVCLTNGLLGWICGGLSGCIIWVIVGCVTWYFIACTYMDPFSDGDFRPQASEAWIPSTIVGLVGAALLWDSDYPSSLSTNSDVIEALTVVLMMLPLAPLWAMPLWLFSYGWFFILLLISGFGTLMTSLLSPVLVLLVCRSGVCRNCLRISKPHRSRYEHGTRYCEHCGSATVLRGVRRITGVIGEDIDGYRVVGDRLYVSLWNQRTEEARNADIDVLEIRQSSDHIDYAYAIASVHLTLYNDVSKPKGYLKMVRVVIRRGVTLSEDALDLLRRHFGEVTYA